MAENQAVKKIKYLRSMIQAPVKHKRVVKGLGFTRLNQVVEREDTPSIRAMMMVSFVYLPGTPVRSRPFGAFLRCRCPEGCGVRLR